VSDALERRVIHLRNETMNSGKGSYLAFMLRLWPVEQDGEIVWRASLESPLTGERRGFASLEALIAFLRGEIVRMEGPEKPGDCT